MQTFLPYADYEKSAACLDNKRLGKQRVECKQILLALGVDVGEHKAKESRWRNHPAVRMWRGHEYALAIYSSRICYEWTKRGFKDTLYSQFVAAAFVTYSTARYGQPKFNIAQIPPCAPPWLGLEVMHASHRSNLLRKDAEYYSKFGWLEPPTLDYVWPVD